MGAEYPPRVRGGGPRSGGGGSRSLQRPVVYAARKLRRQMTLPEVLLWNRLKAKQIGVSFRKQHSIGHYIADFYCAPAKLVIEVDGEAHNRGNQPQRDKERDQLMIEAGYQVLRIAASDILRDIDGALHRIAALTATPLRPLRAHLPVNGEDSA